MEVFQPEFIQLFHCQIALMAEYVILLDLQKWGLRSCSCTHRSLTVGREF